MKDEIKEILDYFRKYMSIDECITLNKIEDYITNLQNTLLSIQNDWLKYYNRCVILVSKLKKQ